MLPLRYGRAWLIAGLVLLAIGLISALTSVSTSLSVTVSDKVVHAAAFLIFMLWFSGVFESRFAPFLVVALSAYGLLIEVLQSLTPSRQPELLDLVADVVGVLLGWALSAAGLSRWCVTLESWFTRRNP